jgi:hypothetical protein
MISVNTDVINYLSISFFVNKKKVRKVQVAKLLPYDNQPENLCRMKNRKWEEIFQMLFLFPR